MNNIITEIKEVIDTTVLDMLDNLGSTKVNYYPNIIGRLNSVKEKYDLTEEEINQILGFDYMCQNPFNMIEYLKIYTFIENDTIKSMLEKRQQDLDISASLYDIIAKFAEDNGYDALNKLSNTINEFTKRHYSCDGNVTENHCCGKTCEGECNCGSEKCHNTVEEKKENNEEGNCKVSYSFIDDINPENNKTCEFYCDLDDLIKYLL